MKICYTNTPNFSLRAAQMQQWFKKRVKLPFNELTSDFPKTHTVFRFGNAAVRSITHFLHDYIQVCRGCRDCFKSLPCSYNAQLHNARWWRPLSEEQLKTKFAYRILNPYTPIFPSRYLKRLPGKYLLIGRGSGFGVDSECPRNALMCAKNWKKSPGIF